MRSVVVTAIMCSVKSVHQELRVSSLTAKAHLGTACAADANHIIVGAYLDNHETGSTIVFGNGNPAEIQDIIRPRDLASGAQFGCAVSTAGGFLAVGAQNDGDLFHKKYGSLYLFDLNSTQLPLVKLLPPTKKANQSFGSSVAFDAAGSAVVTGATSGDGVGAAHVFLRGQGWGEGSAEASIEIVAPSDLSRGDNFGISVGIHGYEDGGYLVAAGANHFNDTSGAVLTFCVSNDRSVVRAATLVADDAVAGSYLGSSTAIASSKQGCTVTAVGSAWADDGRGAVYLFTQHARSSCNSSSSWSQIKLSAPSGASDNAGFGSSIALVPVPNEASYYLTVGAWTDNKIGAVYTYKAQCSSEGSVSVQPLAWSKPDETSDWTYFGSAVALAGDKLVVGADGANAGAGAAYVFEVADFHARQPRQPRQPRHPRTPSINNTDPRQPRHPRIPGVNNTPPIQLAHTEAMKVV